MILSFHPNIVAHKNILCAGRLPNDEDRVAISEAEAVILPQGCSEALYRMSRKHCAYVFPNYDVRFDFPGKLGQARLFKKVGAPFPRTHTFETVSVYYDHFGKKAHKSPLDRRAPRKPRPEGWGQGELYKKDCLPFREAPPGRAGRLHFPCVFKSNLGGEGEGVFLLKTPEDLEQALERAQRTEESGQKGFLLQEYISSGGRSLRVVVIGDEFFSYWRVQQDPSRFLTSLRDGAVIDHDSDPELQEAGTTLVKNFCSKTGINLAGLDLLISEDEKVPGPLSLEINYFFGRRGLGGSLNYYELVERAVTAWLSKLGLSL